ncbi:hypothetical protein [Petropleomorpha daqingensis]|uniref:Uncharacterized protein n=1 Tax=Petropleomorpha daqingensis TaxID=2026353 RepID=A0A853CGU4_9ACTN|nr:hypothetical protein [Petropleomorpha daqingensis]NYJ07030.1 hypothetical protein [Petropleomorpha daqingensis]
MLGRRDERRPSIPDGPQAVVGRRSDLQRLVGTDLAAVTFIADFLEITFDGDNLPATPRLTCLAWPRLSAPEGTWSVGQAGYRDRLVETIGSRVTSVDETPDDGITIKVDGCDLIVRPTEDEVAGPEILQLYFLETGEMSVWRGGEDSFAYLA